MFLRKAVIDERDISGTDMGVAGGGRRNARSNGFGHFSHVARRINHAVICQVLVHCASA